MAEILCDFLCKETLPVYGGDPSLEINRRVRGINAMYTFLYEQGILRDISFGYIDGETSCSFAFEVDKLLPYRDRMLSCGIADAELAVGMLFDEAHVPCMRSGAIQLLWDMECYRDNGGCVEKVRECSLVNLLDLENAERIAQIQRVEGTRAAVLELFNIFSPHNN